MEALLTFVGQLAKLARPVWFAGALATGFILFAPAQLLAQIGVDQLRQEHLTEVGLTFLVTVSLCIVVAGQMAAKLVRSFWRRWYRQRELQSYIENLTPAEQAYLMPFICDGQNTVLWPMADGIAGGLLHKKIVYRSSQIFNALEGVSYNMQPWARKALEKRPELLQGYDPSLYPLPHRRDSWRI